MGLSPPLCSSHPIAQPTERNAVSSRISSGVFVSVMAAPIVEMGETHDVGTRLGMYLTVVALGALAGPPISGAINASTGGYKAVGYYAGKIPFLLRLHSG